MKKAKTNVQLEQKDEKFMKENKIQRLVERSAKAMGGNLQLALFLGAHERTVYRWLSGETKPTADYILDMCEIVWKLDKAQRILEAPLCSVVK